MRQTDKYASLRSRLNKSKRKLEKMTIYVVRPMGNGMLGNAKPCDNCAKFLKRYGITRVKYSDMIVKGTEKISVLREMRIL